VEVYDYTGKLIASEVNPQEVSVSDYPPGFYLLKAIDLRTRQVSIHKFIKAH
jgi:hypothetical protein